MSILINGADESLQVVLDAAPAANQLQCSASWADQGGAGGDNSALSNGTAAVTLVAAPGAGFVRVISGLSIINTDIATRIVKLSKYVSGVLYQIIQISLPAGYQLYFHNSVGWQVLNAKGAPIGAQFADATQVVNVLTNAAGTVTLDCSKGSRFSLALAANVTTLAFTNIPASGTAYEACLDITQDGTGGHTLALPSTMKAIGSSDTVIQTGANAKTRIVMDTSDAGVTWPYAMAKIAA